MRKLIRTDGSTKELLPGMTHEEIRALLGAETLDVVTLHHMGRPLHVMMVDDAGWETEVQERRNGTIVLVPTIARKPINHEATALYRMNCEVGSTHKIVGDVIILPDDDFADA